MRKKLASSGEKRIVAPTTEDEPQEEYRSKPDYKNGSKPKLQIDYKSGYRGDSRQESKSDWESGQETIGLRLILHTLRY